MSGSRVPLRLIIVCSHSALVQPREHRTVVQGRAQRSNRLISTLVAAVAAAIVGVAGCSSTSTVSTTPTPNVTKPTDSLRSVAASFAARDHSRRVASYLPVLRQLLRRCGESSPSALESAVSAGYQRLTSHGPPAGSVLSVMRTLVARTTPNGPPRQCQQAVSELLREVTGTAGSGSSYAGFGGTISAFAAAHRRDPARASSYLPRLSDSRDSYVAGGTGQITTIVRAFDPPISQVYALATIRRQLLPAGAVHQVYSLSTVHCSETIYLNSRLGSLLGSSAAGVMIELTSGRGVSSRFNSSAVDRARLVIGARIGGEPCV